MKSRLIAAAILIPLGLIIALVPQNTTQAYKLTPEQLLEEANSGVQFLSPDEIAELIISEDPSLQLIDVRGADEYEKFRLPNAINIPITDLLSSEWTDYLNQDIRTNVFYSNGTIKSNEAWMITRQMGYRNNYVLQGGLNYFAETIMNPEAPESTSPDEELARYNFRMGANMALGGASVETSNTPVKPKPIPALTKKPKKKRVDGGC